jgi:hypothetical protein
MNEQKLEETNVITEDMRLPEGSAVIQCVLVQDPNGNGGYMDVRAITVGADHLDPANPAHRWLQAVSRRMDEIMREVVGENGRIEEVDLATLEGRILAANEVVLDAPQPGEVLTLSNGQTVTVQDESEPLQKSA